LRCPEIGDTNFELLNAIYSEFELLKQHVKKGVGVFDPKRLFDGINCFAEHCCPLTTIRIGLGEECPAVLYEAILGPLIDRLAAVNIDFLQLKQGDELAAKLYGMAKADNKAGYVVVAFSSDQPLQYFHGTPGTALPKKFMGGRGGRYALARVVAGGLLPGGTRHHVAHVLAADGSRYVTFDDAITTAKAATSGPEITLPGHPSFVALRLLLRLLDSLRRGPQKRWGPLGERCVPSLRV
jgi:hypothetical protein